ncbi:MAG: beta-lactamase family protein [Fimbriimonadaceae bacterium]|nr:beta-lactamase family protein [Fimbriimonadaceae bacterium]
MNSFVGSVFPGAVWAAFDKNETVIRTYGRMSYATDAMPMAVDCIFDLASLTKVMATSMVLLSLAEDDAFDLDAPIADFFPSSPHRQVTIRDLLEHRSGLPDYFPKDQIPKGRDAQDKWIVDSLGRKCDGINTTRYSCLGFLLLQTIAEQLGGAPYDALFQERVAAPLQLTSTFFKPSSQYFDRIPPTEKRDAYREELEERVLGRLRPWPFVQSEVHDPAAFCRGGVSGNAGLFGSIGDLVKVGHCWLKNGEGVCSPTRFREWTQPRYSGFRGLGFDVAEPNGPVAEGGFTVGGAFGHHGFTGTSLWIDPVRGIGCALLSNRIHPTSTGEGINRARTHAIIQSLAVLDSTDSRGSQSFA